MSFYSLVFTVPKDTAENAPYEQKLPVTEGILHQVTVVVLAGHRGVTGCAIDEGLHQIAPTNQNEWFKGDDVTFSYTEYVELAPGTRELVLRGFNTSDHEDHSFIIAVGILPVEVYNAILALGTQLQPMIDNMALLAQFFSQPPPVVK